MRGGWLGMGRGDCTAMEVGSCRHSKSLARRRHKTAQRSWQKRQGLQQLLQVLLAPSSCLPCPPPAPPPRTAPTFTANLRGLGFHSSGRLLAGLVGLLGAGRCFVARGRGRPDSNLLPAFVWLLVRVQEEG